MSSQDTKKRSVRVALGDLLHEEWNPENTAGYDPNLSEGDGHHVDITLGTYSEDNAVPKLALRSVSEIPEGGAGYAAIKANGDGPIQTFTGRIDIMTYVGEQGDLAGGENAQLAAGMLGHEVRSIVHDNVDGVMDPATGELLATDLACSRPRVSPDPDLPGPAYVGRQEATYRLDEDPPNR